MNKFLILAIIATSFATSAFGYFAKPIIKNYCQDVRYIESWKYIESYNTSNGVRNRTGLIEIKMTGVSDEGGKLIIIERIPITGLKWNQTFTTLSFGDKVCAQKGRFSTRLYRQNCDVNLRLRTRTLESGQNICANGSVGISLDGIFHVN